MTNASILERNICHAFEALGHLAPVAEESFWRFRNRHAPKCAERLAYLMADCAAGIQMGVTVILPMLPDPANAENKWRVAVELDDFVRKRIHHHEGICTCSLEETP